MSLPSKNRKAKGGDSQSSGKSTKSNESKQDTPKPSDKSQPTAEQMRIAQLIDNKTEDPFLKEKLKQVMDATQKSIDEAYTALHDCDHDPNRAVNLLLEGIESEWSTSSKKKKNRTSSEKILKEKEIVPEPIPEEDSWDAISGAKQPPNGKGVPPARGTRGGRPFRGGRGGGSNFTTQKIDESARRGGKLLNGGNGGATARGRGATRGPRAPSRGFARGGRGRDLKRPTIETWNPNPSGSQVPNHEVISNEEWDSEEYTGSLANSQIYTSSGNPVPAPSAINNTLITANNENSQNDWGDEPSSQVQPLTQLQLDTNSVSPVVNNSPSKPADISSLYKQYTSMPEPAITPPMAVRSPPIGSNLIMMSQRPTDRSPAIPSTQEIRMQRPRPKIPPPSKIPATAVEMPPDSVENSIGLLDVQFGALELNDSSTVEPIQVSPPTPHHSPSPTADKLLSHQPAVTSDSLLLNDSSFSPVRNSGSNSLPMSDLSSKISDVSSSLYQEPSYQSSPYSKTAQQSPSVYSSAYSSVQASSSSSIIYSSSSSQSTYSSSTSGVYGGISSSYPQYQYSSYPSQQNHSLPILTNSTNSYQSALSNAPQPYGSSNQNVYGTSGLPTPSYSTPYQTYNSSLQPNHKQTILSSSSSSKDFETSQPSQSMNLISSISGSGAMNAPQSLLSASQTTPTSKSTSISNMGKNTVVPNLPAGVTPLCAPQQYIVNQGGIPYFAQQPMYYEDLQMIPQRGLAPPLGTPGYFELGYPTSTTREQYNMNDGRFPRADNTSPVQASSMNQQSGSQAHQQPMMNPTALPQAYAYFYGGSAPMIPGNFQYTAPALYPAVATGGTTGGHGNATSGVYGKGPSNFTGNYGGSYENSQSGNSGSGGDFKTSTSTGQKAQPSQTTNQSSNSDLVNIYSKSLSKSYDKQGFHCATPPPFTLGSQTSGMGPSGAYPQLFIPAAMTHHNTTTLMHQPIHQDGSSNMSSRSQGGTQQQKVVMTKPNYSSSTYWPQN